MHELLTLLTGPFAFVFDPGKRIYWGFLLSSTVLAVGYSYIYTRPSSPAGYFKKIVNFSLLRHPSTRLDITLLFLNHVIRALAVLPLLGSQLALAVWVNSFLYAGFGDPPRILIPAAALVGLYTVTLFICDDLSRFALHCTMHKSRLLWRFHKVHHSAEILTPLTVFRVHPAEMMLYSIRQFIVVGVISGLFVYAFRGGIHVYDILGVNVLGFLFNALGANLRHSAIPLSFGWVERWLISPAQHQRHHSCAPEDHDKNFGTCLALWDRWLGSWSPGHPYQRIKFGLTQTSGDPASGDLISGHLISGHLGGIDDRKAITPPTDVALQ